MKWYAIVLSQCAHVAIQYRYPFVQCLILLNLVPTIIIIVITFYTNAIQLNFTYYKHAYWNQL